MARKPPKRSPKKAPAERCAKEREVIERIDEWRKDYARGLVPGSLAHRVDLIREIICQCHGDKNLHLEVICPAFGYSMRSLERKFREMYGKSMRTYQQETRLERAKSYLESAPNTKLNALASDLGYKRESEFSRFFRRKIGQAPKDYVEAVVDRKEKRR